MKHQLVSLLRKTGLYNISAILFHSLKNFRHVNPVEEIKMKLWGAPDQLPLPPASLVFDVIGHGWRSIYFHSGIRIANGIINNLTHSGVKLKDLHNILDFGCGCGRLIRHIRCIPHTTIFGTDYNGRLIEWCRGHLPFARFATNQLAPPLEFQADTFDLIYAQSIFTHLSEGLQANWLQEFHRILKDEGILYFTTHGDQFIHDLNQQEKMDYKNGKTVIRNLDKEGKNICATYQKAGYYKQKIKSGFEIVATLPGLPALHLRQDVNIFRKSGTSLTIN
jgi:SAM-dependent methyltransferase